MRRPASSDRQGAPPPADPPLSLFAALAVALFWAIEGIDVNEPQLERMAILVSAIVLGWALLRG